MSHTSRFDFRHFLFLVLLWTIALFTVHFTQSCTSRPDKVPVPDTIGMNNGVWFCSTELPPDIEDYKRDVKQPPHPLDGVAARNLQWANGSTIRVRINSTGSQILKDSTRRACATLSTISNLNFTVTELPPTTPSNGMFDIWVAYENSGAWSQIGTNSRAAAGRGPSMNLQEWTVRQRGSILHEFMHALSLLHEQQHPVNGVCYDTLKTLAYYRATQGWSDPQIYWNVITKHNISDVILTQYDRNSNMHYPVPASITCDGRGIPGGSGLTAGDISILRQLNPGRGTPPTDPPVTGGITWTAQQVNDFKFQLEGARLAADSATARLTRVRTKFRQITGQ